MLIFLGLVWLVFFGGEGRDLGGIWEGGLLSDLIDWDFCFFGSFSFLSVIRNVSVARLAGWLAVFCSLAYRHL